MDTRSRGIVIGLALALSASPALAQKQRAPVKLALTDAVIQNVIADLKYASLVAHTNGNTITAPCWDAQLTLVQGWVAPMTDAQGNVVTPPTIHVISDVEKVSEIINSLQANSPVSLACAAMAQAAGKSLATIIGSVLSGGALGLFKLPIPGFVL